MGHPPAYLFVVRHGNRLDAADKKWHLTSPTPYDPPLTYGGWLQSKALGARIATILRQAEADIEAAERDAGIGKARTRKKRKRYKVVVHSSPFLRCVQTSIAISAGLGQAPLNANAPMSGSNAPSPANALSGSNQPPISPPLVAMPSPALKPTLTFPAGTGASSKSKTRSGSSLSGTGPNNSSGSVNNDPVGSNIQKTILRLDAFLGEWLSPEYFEMITPPPSSALMLAGAKAELLRREDYSSYPHFAPAQHIHANSSSGQLWSSPITRPSERTGSMSSNFDLTESVLPPPTSGGQSDKDSDSSAPRKNSAPKVRFVPPSPSLMPAAESGGYVAPTPHYAISLSGKIPDGYVAHARDACVTVDYQWDSMREPLDWGDGGTFSEEWAAMHRRFRRGVQRLVDWYASTESPADVVTRTIVVGAPGDECAIDDTVVEEDEDVETVVVMVSHGAGCNALIGAITHQPALMDVGMASLTMAVRKPGKDFEAALQAAANAPALATAQSVPSDDADAPVPDNASVASSAAASSTKGALPLHQFYDLKIFANTEHLRSASTSSTPSASRVPSASAIFNASRGRMPDLGSASYSAGPTSSPFTYTDSFNRGESRSNSANASLGSIRRPSHNSYSLPRNPSAINTAASYDRNSGSMLFSPSGLSQSPSVGLWSPVNSRLNNVSQTTDEDDDDDMFPDFDHKKKFAPVRKNTKDSLTLSLSGSDKETEAFPAMSTTTAELSPAAANAPALTLSPIKISSGEDIEVHDQVPSPQPGVGAGGLWGSPRTATAGEAPLRDLSSSKRRWTVNERA